MWFSVLRKQRGVDVKNGMSVGMCFVPVKVRKRSGGGFGAFVISKARNRGRGAWVILGCGRNQ